MSGYHQVIGYDQLGRPMFANTVPSVVPTATTYCPVGYVVPVPQAVPVAVPVAQPVPTVYPAPAYTAVYPAANYVPPSYYGGF